MTPDELKTLKELAKAATQGPWKSDYCGDVWTESPDVPLDDSQPEIGPLFRTIGSTPKGPDNGDAAFIAAANPQTVTALVEEVERAHRERDEARAEVDAGLRSPFWVLAFGIVVGHLVFGMKAVCSKCGGEQ